MGKNHQGCSKNFPECKCLTCKHGSMNTVTITDSCCFANDRNCWDAECDKYEQESGIPNTLKAIRESNLARLMNIKDSLANVIELAKDEDAKERLERLGAQLNEIIGSHIRCYGTNRPEE